MEDDKPVKQDDQSTNMDTIESGKTEDSENFDNSSFYKRQIRNLKRDYDTKIALLEQKIMNYEIERVELVQAKEEAQKTYNQVLEVSTFY